MSINFDLYKTFFYVAKYKNITSAAKALYVTQPTVTHAIKSLEKELKCELFVRSSRGVILTVEGQQLYQHIAIACQRIFMAESELLSRQELSSGYISIGASETTLHHFLLPYLAKFRSEYPNIKLKVANANTPVMIESIMKGGLDFAVLVTPKNYKSLGLSINKLAEFQDILIVGKAYKHLINQPLTFQDLSNYPLVCMAKDTITRQFLDETFLLHHTELKPDIELATSDLITPMVENGLGIGIVPEQFARKGLSNGSLFKLNLVETIPLREICFIKKEGYPLSLAASTFAKMLL